jgi:hypothetical protein
LSNFDEDEFVTYRDAYVEELKRQLAVLRRREDLKKNSNQMDIEEKLSDISRMLKLKASFPRMASVIGLRFTKSQLAELYKLLDILIEPLPSLDSRLAFRRSLDAVGKFRVRRWQTQN